MSVWEVPLSEGLWTLVARKETQMLPTHQRLPRLPGGQFGLSVWPRAGLEILPIQEFSVHIAECMLVSD